MVGADGEDVKEASAVHQGERRRWRRSWWRMGVVCASEGGSHANIHLNGRL